MVGDNRGAADNGVAGRIRAAREVRGLTIRECIEAGGPAGWYHIEAGRRTPTLATLRRVAAALGCDVAELL